MFIGQHSAEVFGDYGAGPNHVLPTSGTARYTGGLSVFTFLVSPRAAFAKVCCSDTCVPLSHLSAYQRIRTWLRADGADRSAKTLADRNLLIDDSAELALLEGLHGHAAAALARKS